MTFQYANNQTLASLLQLAQLDTLNTINCHQVGEIVSFNPATQTAEVQIKMLIPYNQELREYPILLDCPCIILGGGESRITFPIKAGDTCIVLFNDRDIDNWYASGQKMEPRTQRMHSFADGIALVGLHNKSNQLSDYLTDGTEWKYKGTSIKLQDSKVTITNGTSTAILNGSQVTITDGAGQAVISGGNVSITGTQISLTGAVSVSGTFVVNGKNVGDTHTHSGVTPGNSNTGVVN